MVLLPSFSRKMGEIETVEAEKMGCIYFPRGTFYPAFPYALKIKQYQVLEDKAHTIVSTKNKASLKDEEHTIHSMP